MGIIHAVSFILNTMIFTNETIKRAVILEVEVSWYNLVYGSFIKQYLFAHYITAYTTVQHTMHNLYTNDPYCTLCSLREPTDRNHLRHCTALLNRTECVLYWDSRIKMIEN